MKIISSTQLFELQQQTIERGNKLPLVCVDRGVLASETTEDETSEDVPLLPSAIVINVNFQSNSHRSYCIKDLAPVYGPRCSNLYVRPSPPDPLGLSKEQIQRILDDSSHIVSTCRNL